MDFNSDASSSHDCKPNLVAIESWLRVFVNVDRLATIRVVGRLVGKWMRSNMFIEHDLMRLKETFEREFLQYVSRSLVKLMASDQPGSIVVGLSLARNQEMLARPSFPLEFVNDGRRRWGDENNRLVWLGSVVEVSCDLGDFAKGALSWSIVQDLCLGKVPC